MIMKSDLGLHPYKIQMTQSVDEDSEKRHIFAVEMMGSFTSFNKIIFSDKACFHFDGVVNKLNFMYWSE